jgi:probable rRNA maturation factor
MIIDIEVEDDGWQALAEVEELARKAVKAAVSAAGRGGDVFVLFASDAEVRAMNRQWRSQDKATNVLSFPAASAMPLPKGEMVPLGDVVLAYETVAREATEQGKPLADHATHLIVHGTLHLLGYDHETDAEADDMENLERKILAGLGIADPYQS